MTQKPDEHDDWLSEQLRQVRVPADLKSRLLSLTLPSDAELDAELRDIDVPPTLLTALHGIPRRAAWERRARQARRATRWAVAASVLLVCSVTYYSIMLRSIYETIPIHRARSPVFALEASWVRPALVENASEIALVGQPPLIVPPPTPSLGQLSEQAKVFMPASLVSAADNTTVMQPFARLPLLADPLLLAVEQLAPSTHVESSEALLALPRTPRPGQNVARGAQAKILAQPQLTKSNQPASVPLGVGVASYELARDWARRGVWPQAAQVRSEEFVAALAPLTVAAPTRVTPAPTAAQPRPTPYVPAVNWQLSTGPSPLSSPEHLLFHVALRIRDLPATPHPTTHLSIVVDTSASMGVGERLAQVQRALLGLLPQLRGNDRLDLIATSERPRILIEGAGVADVAAWRAAVESLSPQGGGQLLGGWLTALSLVRADHGQAARRRVLLVTDGREPLDESAVAAWRGTFERVRREGIISELVQVVPIDAAPPAWERLVQLAGGKIDSATRPAQLSGLLVEQLTGRSQVIFSGAKLSVQFSGLSVASYRLLGHESTGIDAPAARGAANELYSGETIAASFEVLPTLGASSGDGDWAVATLEWRDLTSGETRKTSQRLLRSQVKTSPADTTAAWQAGTVALTLGEILRGTPVAQRITVADVTNWARQIPAAMAEQREYRDFLTLLEQLNAARPQGPPGRPTKPRSPSVP